MGLTGVFSLAIDLKLKSGRKTHSLVFEATVMDLEGYFQLLSLQVFSL